MSEATAASAIRDLVPAHQALLRQSQLQFHFARQPPPPKPPHWLEVLLHSLAPMIGPILPYIFWGGLAVGILIILVFIAREILYRRRQPVHWRANMGKESGEWRPAPEQARALLAEADRLAQQGLYEEAAHLILLRSIEDIQSRRPNAVRPSLTSRDIAVLPGLPASARDTFVGIAQAVERSLFGGRSLGQEEFTRCRAAYEAFAAAGAWA